MTVCEPPCVAPEDIADGADIRELAGIRSRGTLIAWRRDRDFPAPIVRTRSGVELWDRRDVESWLRDQQPD